jgi:hypothetical protein
MRALTLVADSQLVIAQMPAPPSPGSSDVQMESRRVFGKIGVDC